MAAAPMLPNFQFHGPNEVALHARSLQHVVQPTPRVTPPLDPARQIAPLDQLHVPTLHWIQPWSSPEPLMWPMGLDRLGKA